VGAFFGSRGDFRAFFFNRVFGRFVTREFKKAAFFVMSAEMDFFEKKSVFLNSPCYETPKKRLKKVDKK
jgi:hypothetical protein